MRRAVVLSTPCDKCGVQVKTDPRGGDRQGGPVLIGFPASAVNLLLCSDCSAPLYELARYAIPEGGGVVAGSDSLDFLPWSGDPPPQQEAPTMKAGASVVPPRFTA